MDFVRKAVRAIGRCAIKLERAAERCISVLLELIKIKVNYVVQEAIIVIKDIFRRYPNTWVPTFLCFILRWHAYIIHEILSFYLSLLHGNFSFRVLITICSYESIIATLCESLDTLDEPEAKVLLDPQ